MKKRYLLMVFLLIAVLCFAACGEKEEAAPPAEPAAGETAAPAEAAPAETITLRFADTANENDPDGLAAKYFADMVNEKTNGQVVIEYYGSNQLGSDKEILQACMSGTIDIAKCSVGNMADFSSAMAFSELPCMFNNLDHALACFEGEIGDQVRDQLWEDLSVHVLFYTFDGGEARVLGTNKPITLPSDFDNMNMRTTGSAVEVATYGAWGASPVTVAWADLYTAMQQNMVEGYYAQPSFMIASMLQECTDYVTYPDLVYTCSVRVIGEAAIEKLGGKDSELFKTVCECGEAAHEYLFNELWPASRDTYKQQLIDAGVEIIELTDEQRAQWKEATMPIYDEFMGKIVDQELIDQIQALDK